MSTGVDAGAVDKRRRRPTQRGIEIVDMHRTGLTFAAIGDHFGISRQAAHKSYWATMDAVAAQSVDAHRAAMVDELHEVIRVAMAVMHARHVVVSNGHIVSEITGHHPLVNENGEAHPLAGEPIYGDPLEDHGPKLDAGRTVIAAHARLSKLVGADAPVEMRANDTLVHYHVTLGGDVDAAKAALT